MHTSKDRAVTEKVKHFAVQTHKNTKEARRTGGMEGLMRALEQDMLQEYFRYCGCNLWIPLVPARRYPFTHEHTHTHLQRTVLLTRSLSCSLARSLDPLLASPLGQSVSVNR
jgi:hypothetical protein